MPQGKKKKKKKSSGGKGEGGKGERKKKRSGERIRIVASLEDEPPLTTGVKKRKKKDINGRKKERGRRETRNLAPVVAEIPGRTERKREEGKKDKRNATSAREPLAREMNWGGKEAKGGGEKKGRNPQFFSFDTSGEAGGGGGKK